MKLITVILSLCIATASFAQVGINNTDPKATLDITASNQAAPNETDGILVPRIDAFSATNPGVDQNGMLIYLTTTSGGNAPGFYYWDATSTTWIGINSGATNAWEITGNGGTDEATDFLGTTDTKDVMFRRNNIDKMRIDFAWTAFTDEIKIKKDGTAGANDDLVRLDDSSGSNSGRVTVFNDDNVQHYIDGEGAVEFNLRGLDTDFKIESTTDDEAFLLDATNGQIKLGNYGTGAITGTAARTLAVDANGLIIEQPLAAASNAWNFDGNAGTTSGTDFIGTTDAQDLDIRTNNIIHNRFTTKGQLEFLNTGGSVLLGEGTGDADDLVNRRNILIGEGIAPNVSTGSALSYDSAYNVGLGYQSMTSLTTGASNIAIGRQALNGVTTENENIAIGRQALNKIAGRQNISIGAYAGLNRDSGNQNVFIGYNSAGFRSGDGSSNTAIGASSFSRIETATGNTIVGTSAGSHITTGNYNTVIGKSAGMSESGASGNVEGTVIIGNAAGAINQINNALIIHNVKTFNASSKPLIGGVFANSTYNSLNNGPFNDNRLGVNVDLGTNAANLTHTLTVGGTAKIQDVLNLEPGTAPTTPAEGDLYFDATTKKLRCYDGTTWQDLF